MVVIVIGGFTVCRYEGSVNSYHLLAINRRVRNWNHLEYDCATRHGLEKVRGKNDKLQSSLGYWDLADRSYNSTCAGQMVTSPTGAFTRAQQLNITTQKWTLGRNLASLLSCCGTSRITGLLKPTLRPGFSQGPSISLLPGHHTQQGLNSTGTKEGEELLV